MKVLVTGANGYIGQGVVRHLLDNNHEVVATDFAVDHVDARAIKVPGNIFETENPYEAFGCPDVLVHLAWRDGFMHGSLNHINDLPNHYDFLMKMLHAGIKTLCVMGSMHEVGFYEGCIKEDSACNPLSLYGVSKNALRQMMEIAVKGTETNLIWLRGYYIVGNAEYGCSIFSKIASAAKEGKETFPFTTGQNQYDFIDYEPFCEQIAQAAVQTEVLGTIECCTGKPEKLADRVERFIKENNFDIKLAYGTFPDRPYDSKAVWGDATKINAIIENAK